MKQKKVKKEITNQFLIFTMKNTKQLLTNNYKQLQTIKLVKT